MSNTSIPDILIFKTNIKFRKQLKAVQAHIEREPHIIKWNVDFQDIDRILRIESRDLQPSTVESLIQQAGYYCEELKD